MLKKKRIAYVDHYIISEIASYRNKRAKFRRIVDAFALRADQYRFFGANLSDMQSQNLARVSFPHIQSGIAMDAAVFLWRERDTRRLREKASRTNALS